MFTSNIGQLKKNQTSLADASTETKQNYYTAYYPNYHIFRHFENFLLKLLFNSQVVTEMAQEFSSSKTPQISEFYSQQRYTALKVDDFYANLIP